MMIHDVTLVITDGMEVYPGDPPVTVRRVAGTTGGEQAGVSELSMGSHTGTHVDPPRHFFTDGAGVDELSLDAMIGPAVVVEAPGAEISLVTIENAALDGAMRVLFKTRGEVPGSGKGPTGGGAYLTGAAAVRLVEMGVSLVGVDSPSVDGLDSPSHEAHRTLLGAGVVIVEGLDLSGVSPGGYGLICLPLKVAGCDGAPARVVLTEG